MGYSCAQKNGVDTSLVTTTLRGPLRRLAELGQWLRRKRRDQTGSTICFAQSLIKANDTVIARANGTFRVVAEKGLGRELGIVSRTRRSGLFWRGVSRAGTHQTRATAKHRPRLSNDRERAACVRGTKSS